MHSRDPILSHERELKLRDNNLRRLKHEMAIVKSHYRKAAEILFDFTDVLSEAADTLRQAISSRGVDSTLAYTTARQCDRVIAKHMERISEINAHVTTSFDELTAKLDEAKDRARQAEKLSGVIETWRTKLAEWQLSVEDGAFKLVHFRYQTIVSNSLAEAVELALSVQEKADDCQPQGT